MSGQPNPRLFITPDSFSVATELLGRPLAAHWRRVAAMGVDLVLVAILVALGGGAILGLVAALILFRASGRLGAERIVPRSMRTVLRALAAILLLVVGMRAWGSAADRFNDHADSDETTVAPENRAMSFGNVDLDFSVRDAAALARLGVGLRGDNDPGHARELADSLVALLNRSGARPSDYPELRAAAHQMAGSENNELVRTALDSAFGQPARLSGASHDSLALLYARALRGGDSAGADSVRPALAAALSEEELTDLRRQLQQASREIERQREQLARLRGRGSLSTLISATANDLGLGLGWSAVYFTSFLALMRGQTPGKRLLRVRVVRLDARPIGWWIAFERFGGYFASLTLGLLGFLQILWDRNRQGLHDKAVETVVIAD
jgi:hypothetical protein